MSRTRTLVAISVLSASLAAQAAQPLQPLPEDRAKGAATITEDELRSWLTTLTSEAYAGRGTGTDGFLLAARLVRDHFKSLGLEPAGDDGTYWQQVPWTRLQAAPECSHLLIRKGEDTVCKLAPGSGLHGTAMSSAGAEGPPVLVVLRKGDTSVLRDLDLENKIVLTWSPDGRTSRRLGSQLRTAKVAGHVAVDDAAVGRYPSVSGLSRPGKGAGNRAVRGRRMTPNELFIGTKQLDAILAAAGSNRATIGDDDVLIELPGLSAELQVSIVSSDAPAYNVVGILRGGDPKLADEYVVVGSHLDHLGARGNRMFPGADDDGSGSVGVLAVAQAFAKNPVRPNRSILFVTFCGEEMGLIGSAFFAKNPPIPLSSIVAELQMDMIGRNEQSRNESAEDNLDCLHLIGTEKLSKDLHDLCLERNKRHAGFELEWDEEDVFSRSDHYNFAKYGVPIAFFFTGFHPDYHRSSDTVEKIDFGKLRRVATYVYDIGFELAMAEGRPLVDPERWNDLRGRMRGNLPQKPAAPLRK